MNAPTDPPPPPPPPPIPSATPVPPPGYAYRQPQPDGLAIAGMVLGIVGLFLGFLWAVPPILAIIFSAVALHRINNSNGWRTGSGMAIAGLTTGIIGLGFWGLMILFVLSF
jgi:Domain of unknown function (DUF4190)